jgi:hypothetical protein
MARLPLAPSSSQDSPVHDRFPRTPPPVESRHRHHRGDGACVTSSEPAAVVTDMDMATVHKLFYSKGTSDRRPQQASYSRHHRWPRARADPCPSPTASASASTASPGSQAPPPATSLSTTLPAAAHR